MNVKKTNVLKEIKTEVTPSGVTLVSDEMKENVIEIPEKELTEKEIAEEAKKYLGKVKYLAIENGLLSLNVKDLILLADSYRSAMIGKKEEIANAIMGKGKNAEIFVLGKPVGTLTLKVGIQGFKAGVIYPVDSERKAFFIKYKVIKR